MNALSIIELVICLALVWIPASKGDNCPVSPTYVTSELQNPATPAFPYITFDTYVYILHTNLPNLFAGSMSSVNSVLVETLGELNKDTPFEWKVDIGSKKLAIGNLFTATIRVIAAPLCFTDTANDVNGDRLYAKLTELLERTIKSRKFSNQITDLYEHMVSSRYPGEAMTIHNLTLQFSPYVAARNDCAASKVVIEPPKVISV